MLKASRAKITSVATDMAGGYIAAVMEHLPKAALVFDRFHVVKLMNEKLTDLRREMYHELTDKQHRKMLKDALNHFAIAFEDRMPKHLN